MRRCERFLVLGILAALLLPACATLQEPGGQAAAFRTLRRGSAGQEDGVLVLRTEAQLQELWARLYKRQGSAPPLPGIDFSRETAIGVFRGCLPNTCYGIEVRQVTGGGAGTTLWVVDTDPGAGCMCGMAVTCPFHLVAVPRFEGEPQVRRSTKTSDCATPRRP